MKKIYISGKIADDDVVELNKNLARFHDMEKKLGVECFNPANLPQGNTYEYLLACCVLEIVQNKPDMLFMKGWEDSRGARLEHEIAKQLGLQMQYE